MIDVSQQQSMILLQLKKDDRRMDAKSLTSRFKTSILVSAVCANVKAETKSAAKVIFKVFILTIFNVIIIIFGLTNLATKSIFVVNQFIIVVNDLLITFWNLIG